MVIVIEGKEWQMAVLVASVSLLLLLALAGSDYIVSNTSPDELSNMGVEKKS
jgi:hypothetical protein